MSNIRPNTSPHSAARFVLYGALLVLVGFWGAAGAALAQGKATMARLSGTLTYRQRIALTPEAVVEVRLLETTRADRPVLLTRQEIKQPGQVPIRFILSYPGDAIAPRRRYAVDAVIREGGQARFRTQTPFPVLTYGSPRDNVEVVLSLGAAADSPGSPVTAPGTTPNLPAPAILPARRVEGALRIGSDESRYAAQFHGAELVVLEESTEFGPFGASLARYHWDNEDLVYCRVSGLRITRADTGESGQESIVLRLWFDRKGNVTASESFVGDSARPVDADTVKNIVRRAGLLAEAARKK